MLGIKKINNQQKIMTVKKISKGKVIKFDNASKTIKATTNIIELVYAL